MPALKFENFLGNDPAAVIDVHNDRDVFAHYRNGEEKIALTRDGFIRTVSGWAKRYVPVPLGDLAADSDLLSLPLLRGLHDLTITNISVGTDTTVAANASHYQTIGVYNSQSSTPVATLSTATQGFSKHVPRDFSGLDATLKKLAAGQSLYLKLTKTGNGVALSGVVVSITFEIDQPRPASGDPEDNVFRFIAGDAGTDGLIESDHEKRDHLSVRYRGKETFNVDVDGKISGSAPDQYHYAVLNVGDIADADGGAKKSPLLQPHCDIEVKKVFFGQTETVAADSDTDFTQVLVKDGSGNVIVDGFVNGPNGGGQDMVKGMLYDMGEVNEKYAAITSTGQLQAEYVCNGTAPTVKGLTFVIVYKKTS
ncbi:hypothetical protein LLH00_06000 [bacterium]|nr:hypothetical protein [bacterium]